MKRVLLLACLLLLAAESAGAQQAVSPCVRSGENCAPVTSANPLPVTSSAPSGTQDVNLKQVGGNALTTTLPVSGTVSAAQSGTWTVQPGNTVNTTAWLYVPSSQYPSGAIPLTASATGTTGATTATLAAHATKTTYICGFSIRANATAAVTNNATVTGTVTGTLNFTQFTAPVATGLGITEPSLGPVCIPGSAANTAVAVVSGAPGTGGVVSVSAWGYQL